MLMIISHSIQFMYNKTQPFTLRLTEETLKRLPYNQNHIEKTWNLDLPVKAEYIYIHIIDNVKGKSLRKLLKINKKKDNRN